MKSKKILITMSVALLVLLTFIGCKSKEKNNEANTRIEKEEIVKDSVELDSENILDIEKDKEDINAQEVSNSKKEENQAKIEKDVQDVSIDIYSIVEMSIDNDIYTTNNNINLVLKNLVNLENFNLETTKLYTLQFFNKDSWETVKLKDQEENERIFISTDKAFEQVIKLSNLTVGDYRISKVIYFSKEDNQKEESVVVLQKGFSIKQ